MKDIKPMARPREFSIETATQNAMHVFWAHGYDGASLPELLKGMGIARGSFYKAFDGKKPLFMSVLDLYDQEAIRPAVTLLSGPDDVDGWKRIMLLFNQVVAVVASGDHRGCLVCTAAAGPAANDADIAKAVGLALDKMRKGFETALGASRQHSDLNVQQRRAFADMLTAQYVGLRILARSRAPLATLERSFSAIQGLTDLID
jgi:TetR/AcrR family transcriptional repressor of nem operon